MRTLGQRSGEGRRPHPFLSAIELFTDLSDCPVEIKLEIAGKGIENYESAWSRAIDRINFDILHSGVASAVWDYLNY